MTEKKQKEKSIMKTFRLSHYAVRSLENMYARYQKESGVNISRAKILEVLIFNNENKSLGQLLKMDK